MKNEAVMDKAKRKRLEAKGWRVGGVDAFLELTPAEAELVEIRTRLALAMLRLRKQSQLTQAQLAKVLETSQSRVAKLEANDASVSIDLMMHWLVRLGAGRADIGGLLAGATSEPSLRKLELAAAAARPAARPTSKRRRTASAQGQRRLASR